MARFGKGTMGKNLINIIEFARQAWKFDANDTPAMILANVFKRMEEKNQATTLLNCMSQAVIGNLTNNYSALSAHAWMKRMLPNYNDNQIADIVKVFTVKKIEEEMTAEVKFENAVKPYNTLLGVMTDDLINRTITSAKNNGKDDASLNVPKIPGLINQADHIVSLKLINNFKTAYGTEMSDKLMGKQMKQINAFYKTLSPLTFYTEKSAYKK